MINHNQYTEPIATDDMWDTAPTTFGTVTDLFGEQPRKEV
jgi:hypothetical protein